MDKIRILVADDLTSVRRLISSGLRNNFPDIVIEDVSDGQQARVKLETGHFDLVLCDWEMPYMTGEELLKWVRERSELKTLPFIMVTSKGGEKDVVRAIQIGVSGYLIKPFTIEALVQKVTSVMTRLNRRKHERFTVEGKASLAFRSGSVNGTLMDLSIASLSCELTSKGPFPNVLETVTVDMELTNHCQVKGIKGFVIRLQALEPLLDCKTVRLAIKFENDNVPEINSILEQLIASPQGKIKGE